MKSLPLPENSMVLRLLAPSAAEAASSIVFASWARAAIAHKPDTASRMIKVFFISPSGNAYEVIDLIKLRGTICPLRRRIKALFEDVNECTAARFQMVGGPRRASAIVRSLKNRPSLHFKLRMLAVLSCLISSAVG